jgi:hypothetical protein
MFETGQEIEIINSYNNHAEPGTVVKVTETQVTVMGWDFTADFDRKDDSFWNMEFYLTA